MTFRRRNSHLFAYPLPDPQQTVYQRLGIAPEASTGEIREARGRLIEQLTKQKRGVDKQLADIYQKTPTLQETQRAVETLRQQGDRQAIAALAERESALARLEDQALAHAPNYRLLLQQSRDLQQEINEINQLNLENPEERAKYDQETPPCALLKLEDHRQAIFTEEGRRLALLHLRLELADFLETQDEDCYHPSDLTRRDFSSDFIRNPLLD